MFLLLAVLPILLSILAGYLIAVSGILPRAQWGPINVLSFRILIPAVLIRAIAGADLSGVTSGGWILAVLLTLAIAAAGALSMRLLFSHQSLPNPAFSTLFQTTTRWNAFIALAAAEQFIGPHGMAMIALAMAVLIPVINIANVVVLVACGSARTRVSAMFGAILRNPLVIGCMIGLAVNLSGLQLAMPIERTLDLIGKGALGVGLMAVGAGVALRRLFDSSLRIWLGVGLRLVLCPLAFLLLAGLFGLTPEDTLAGALIFAVPAAANGYVVAQRMGGDADLYADVLTWQTILSLGLLPLLAMFVQVGG